MGAQLAAMGIQKGGEIAQDVINTGMGLLLEGHNDRRQIKQQKKLQDLQLIGMKDMADYNQQLQLKTWEATNYNAQKEQLIKAGLNPGLLYGMSGGGGATTGGASGAGVSGGQAPSGGQEVMGMMMQKQLMEAQTQNIKADTAKKEAETEKTKGIDTTEAQTRVQSIAQGIENAKAVEELTRIQTRTEAIRADVAEGTKYEAMGQIVENMRKTTLEVQAMVNQNWIDRQTARDKIGIIAQESIGAVIENEAKRTGIQKTKEEINKIATDIEQKWKEIEQRGQEIDIKTFEAETKRMYPGISETGGNILQQIFNAIDDTLGTNKQRRVPYKVNENK